MNRLEFSVYDPATGCIVSTMSVYGEDERAANLPPGMSWVEGYYDPSTFYVGPSGVTPYPPRPADHMTFDYASEQWVDARGPEDMPLARMRAMSRLTSYVARKRTEIITDLPGQDMIYLRKEEEGRRYLDLPEEPETLEQFPLIAAEVGVTAPTAYQVAMIWVQLGSMWVSIAALLEGLRMTFSAQIQSASTPTEIDALMLTIEALP